MFARIKKSGKYQYLQIVENRKEKGKVKQRVISTIGRMDQLQAKGRVETLIRSLSRFSEKTMLILSGKSDVSADAVKIGPSIIFERLWKETGIKKAIQRLLIDRRFEFDVERAIFLTVLHRLIVSGSDRFCQRWRTDYSINGTEQLDLHHLYRAMTFLGEVVDDQKAATPFTPRCNKDLIERVFRDVKTMLHTRPVYHQKDENIRGHLFCSFLALVLRKELERRLNAAGHIFEWSDIKQDLKALQQVTIEEDGKRLAIRSECKGVCGKVFQSVGVVLPPTIKEV